ncbi:hypothetical protein TRVL_03368 [Trypanosoma vivax]|nr:hypothetical protein TRVL_03368 [Trypanosoma vivax]
MLRRRLRHTTATALRPSSPPHSFTSSASARLVHFLLHFGQKATQASAQSSALLTIKYHQSPPLLCRPFPSFRCPFYLTSARYFLLHDAATSPLPRSSSNLSSPVRLCCGLRPTPSSLIELVLERCAFTAEAAFHAPHGSLPPSQSRAFATALRTGVLLFPFRRARNARPRSGCAYPALFLVTFPHVLRDVFPVTYLGHGPTPRCLTPPVHIMWRCVSSTTAARLLLHSYSTSAPFWRTTRCSELHRP